MDQKNHDMPPPRSGWRRAPGNRAAFENADSVVQTVPVLPAQASDMVGTALPQPRPASGFLNAAARKAGLGDVARWVEASRTDHLLVARNGIVLARWSAPGTDDARPHLLFSVTKSVVGVLAEILAAKGVLDLSARAGEIAPWPGDCAFAGVTLHAMLDMEVPLAFIEGDSAPGDLFRRYRAAMGWDAPPDGKARETLAAFLSTLAPAPSPAARFQYASPTTDALGLTIESATGARLTGLIRDHVLAPAGCTGPALMTVDAVGAPRAAGGLCLTADDLARIGMMMLDPPPGAVAEAVAAIRAPRDRSAWLAGDFPDLFPDGDYRSSWYRTGDASGAFCAIGIHGQWLWCDPGTGTVIVRLASEDEPEAAETEQQCLALFRSICTLE